MVIDEMGLKVRRTRVGDSYVSDELKRVGKKLVCDECAEEDEV